MRDFEKIKEELCVAPLLAHPDMTKIFYLGCDASDYGVRIHLYQREEEDDDEKDGIGTAASWDRKSVVVTDHKGLSFMLTCRHWVTIVIKWLLALQEFDFNIH
ncbi:uncharacterized protein LOC124775777 [Schistocerca piceifrons]|uniref:uncharacterized protein LOC124753078 n=1 Tax=Schistocerca piceifrons TaxID=274613 RepID=UPI001F5E8943|nr:uncharacterized protein LOC124753078 [Schistocerca piceifrons]XP_047106566.1 uncharacterized protein LOC124775777 [Schistocerca piceifrons]